MTNLQRLAKWLDNSIRNRWQKGLLKEAWDDLLVSNWKLFLSQLLVNFCCSQTSGVSMSYYENSNFSFSVHWKEEFSINFWRSQYNREIILFNAMFFQTTCSVSCFLQFTLTYFLLILYFLYYWLEVCLLCSLDFKITQTCNIRT